MKVSQHDLRDCHLLSFFSPVNFLCKLLFLKIYIISSWSSSKAHTLYRQRQRLLYRTHQYYLRSSRRRWYSIVDEKLWETADRCQARKTLSNVKSNSGVTNYYYKSPQWIAQLAEAPKICPKSVNIFPRQVTIYLAPTSLPTRLSFHVICSPYAGWMQKTTNILKS